MILLNVLAIVAVASAVVVVMTSSQDVGIQRAQRMREAAQAAAYARGGELSAVTALRRDKSEAPQSDYPREPWGAVGQADVAVKGGRFSLTIADAQARFNVNNVAPGGLLAQAALTSIFERIAAPAGAAARVTAYISTAGPVADLDALAAAGLDPETIQKLGGLATALPGLTSVNVNTASEALLAIMLNNPVAARVLAARRDRAGFLTADDLAAAKVVLPGGMGFTSDLYWLRTTATVGDTRQVLTSLIERRVRDRVVEAVVVARRRGAGAPDPTAG